MADEKHVWCGRPSQVLNLGAFTFWGVLALTLVLLPISAGVILWKYLVLRNHKYELSTQRLTTESGVFSKSIDTLELYRVQDIQYEQPFVLRLFGLANIVLLTADPTSPIHIIQGVPNARELYEWIRKLVERRRSQKNIWET